MRSGHPAQGIRVTETRVRIHSIIKETKSPNKKRNIKNPFYPPPGNRKKAARASASRAEDRSPGSAVKKTLKYRNTRDVRKHEKTLNELPQPSTPGKQKAPVPFAVWKHEK